jgi:hypothetical protein
VPAILPHHAGPVTFVSEKESAGVVPAVATLVVNSGDSAPALNVVTVPDPAPAAVQVQPPAAVRVFQ